MYVMLSVLEGLCGVAHGQTGSCQFLGNYGNNGHITKEGESDMSKSKKLDPGLQFLALESSVFCFSSHPCCVCGLCLWSAYPSRLKHQLRTGWKRLSSWAGAAVGWWSGYFIARDPSGCNHSCCRLPAFSQAQMGLSKGRGWRWAGFPTVGRMAEVLEVKMGTAIVTVRLRSRSLGAFCFSESLECHN